MTPRPEQRAQASYAQCQALSWLELRRAHGEIDARTYEEAFGELVMPWTPDRVAHLRERLAIPPGFAPVPPLDEQQRQKELDWIETGLRRSYLTSYAGRHVVDHRFVALHVCGDVGAIVMSTRRRASFGTRVWAELARFTLPELENTMVCLARDKLGHLAEVELVSGWYIDVEANTVVVWVKADVEGQRAHLQRRYGPMITVEYGVATAC